MAGLVELRSWPKVAERRHAVADAERQNQHAHVARVTRDRVVDGGDCGRVQRPRCRPEFDQQHDADQRGDRAPPLRPPGAERRERAGEQDGQSQRRDNRKAGGCARQAHRRDVSQQGPRARDVGVGAGQVDKRAQRQQGKADRQPPPDRLRSIARKPDRHGDHDDRHQAERGRVLHEDRRCRGLRVAEQQPHDRVIGVGSYQRQQVHAARAAAPENPRAHKLAIDHPFDRAIQHGRQGTHARQHANQHRLDRQRTQVRNTRQAGPPPGGEPRHHQHGEYQHGRIEAAHVDRHAQHREAATAAEGQAGGQAAETHDQDVKQPHPRPASCRRRRARDADRDGRDIQHGDHHAVDAVVRVAQGRPGDAQADQRGAADGAVLLGVHQRPDERGQRRGRREAEVTGTAGDEYRRPRERDTRQERLGPRGTGRGARQPVRHERGEHAHQQVDEVERRHHAEQRDQRECQQVQEDGVVVLRQVDASGERQNLLGAERVVATKRFLVEDPLVPDVHTGIAAGITSEVSPKIEEQWPREGTGDQPVAKHDGELGGWHAHGRQGSCITGRVVAHPPLLISPTS